MIETIPKVLAINDISGFGRCSLSVIIPILSCIGVQVCSIPTAILSTHTGNLGDFQFRDLTDFIKPAFNHYQDLNLEFECVYTGFLGSASQIDICLEILKSNKNAFKVVDPVMADNGKLYKTFDNNMKNRIIELVVAADMITPNLTEAFILLGQPHKFETISCQEARSMLLKLSKLYSRYVIITGVNLADGFMANIGYDRDSNFFWRVNCDYVPVSYPGTGDIYASIVVGSFLKGDSMPIAMDKATKFLELAIKTTYSYKSDPRYGVMFESCLGWFAQNHYFKGYDIL